MADVILSSAGSAIGEAVAGAGTEAVAGLTASQIGAAIGQVVGSLINQLVIYPALFGRDESDLKQNVTVGAMAGDVTKPSATYGTPIPVIAGGNRIRVAGTLIWADQIREEVFDAVQTSVTKRSGGKGGGGSVKVKTTTYVKKYEYFGSFAFMFCVGPAALSEIRANGKQLGSVYISEGVSFHRGDDTELPDSVIETAMGTGNAPAYRGRTYVVFRDVNLDPYGNRIPEVSAFLIPTIGTLSGLIEWVFNRCGLFAPDDYEIDPSVDTTNFSAVVIADTKPAYSILQDLATAFGLVFYESDGKIKVKKIA